MTRDANNLFQHFTTRTGKRTASSWQTVYPCRIMYLCPLRPIRGVRRKKSDGLRPGRGCGNPQYSWVIYFILSNFCRFSQLGLSTHPLLLCQFLSPYQSFVVLSNFCRLLTLCYLLTFYFIYTPYKCTCCTHHKQLFLLSYRAHALCANIPF